MHKSLIQQPSVGRRWRAAVRRFDPARLLFMLSLCLLAFGYGMATQLFHIWPYAIYEDAKTAYRALYGAEPDDLFATVIRLDPRAPARPVITTFDAAAGHENLLISGGPFVFMQQCPKHGCMAWVIDRQGHVLHSWDVDIDALLTAMPKLWGRHLRRNFYPSGMAFLPDGGLVMAIQSKNTYPYKVGLVRVARDGAIVWMRWDDNHHWLTVEHDGTIFAPNAHSMNKMDYFGQTAAPTRCPEQLESDGIGVYAPDGQRLHEISIFKALERSNYAGLLASRQYACDPVHVNAVELVPAGAAARLPGVNAGDLLVSLREASTLAIIDRNTGDIKRIVSGRTINQHSPKFLPDGSVLAFDNLGGQRSQGGSRIVRYDFASGAFSTVFPRPGETRELPFLSPIAGHIDVSPDGKRAMVASTEAGQAFEIDVASGRPLWSLHNSFDITPYLDRKQLSTADGTRAWVRLWGVYYLSDDELRAAGLPTAVTTASRATPPPRRG